MGVLPGEGCLVLRLLLLRNTFGNGKGTVPTSGGRPRRLLLRTGRAIRRRSRLCRVRRRILVASRHGLRFIDRLQNGSKRSRSDSSVLGRDVYYCTGMYACPGKRSSRIVASSNITGLVGPSREGGFFLNVDGPRRPYLRGGSAFIRPY